MTTITYCPELSEQAPSNVDATVDYIGNKCFVETKEAVEIKRGIRFCYVSDRGNNVYEMTDKAYEKWSATRRVSRLELLD